jgi:hypothetical protein
MADDNTILLGTEVETADAIRSFAELRETAVAEMRKIADDSEKQRIVLDFDEADAALKQVQEEFREVGTVSQESLAKAEAALRKVGGAFGFKEDLKLIPPELEEVSRAAKAAGAAMDRFAADAEKGGRGAQRSATQASVAIDKLETAILQARATGGAVPPEWEKRLASLRAEMARNIETSGRFAAAQKEIQDELAASTERAAGFDEQATTLTEGIIKRFPKAQAAIVGFGASVATVQLAYRETRQFVDFMRERFGIDIDKGIQEGIEAWAEFVDFVVNSEDRIQEAIDLEVNAGLISDRLRRQQGETLQELTARIDSYSAGLRQARLDMEAADEAAQEFAEGVAGIEVGDLEKRIQSLLDVLGQSKGDFGDLASSAVFPRFAGEVKEISEVLRRYKETLRATLSGQELIDFDAAVTTFERSVRDKLAGTVTYAVEQTKALLAVFGVQTPEAIRKSVESLRGLIEVFGGLGEVTHEQAAQVAAEADRILKAIALLPASQREALADTVASLHATSDAYRKHAEDVEAFAASGTKAIEEATAARLAAWEKEKAALAGLSEVAGSTRDALLKSLDTKRPQAGGDRTATDPRGELAELKLKPIQTEEDLARIEQLQDQLGGLRQRQEEARAGSEEVEAAISRFRQELEATGTSLTTLDQEGISVLLSRLQQTAEESGVTASQISEAFAGVDTVVAKARERAAELNSSAVAAQEVARGAAAQAQALGQGTHDIVGSLDKAGQTLISNLETAVETGNRLVERTVETGKKATSDVVAVVEDGQVKIVQAGSATAEFLEKYGEGAEVIAATIGDANKSTGELAAGTEKAGAAVKNLVLGVDGLGTGMERVALESSKATEELQGIQDTADGAGEALKLIGTHATDAATPVSTLATGLEAAGKSAEPLHSSAGSIRQISEDVPDLVRELSQLEKAEATQKRADAYGVLAVNLKACAVAAGQLRAALPSAKEIRDEAEAFEALATALAKVVDGLHAEREAREGEGAPN